MKTYCHYIAPQDSSTIVDRRCSCADMCISCKDLALKPGLRIWMHLKSKGRLCPFFCREGSIANRRSRPNRLVSSWFRKKRLK